MNKIVTKKKKKTLIYELRVNFDNMEDQNHEKQICETKNCNFHALKMQKPSPKKISGKRWKF